jgi:hypothetical protein
MGNGSEGVSQVKGASVSQTKGKDPFAQSAERAKAQALEVKKLVSQGKLEDAGRIAYKIGGPDAGYKIEAFGYIIDGVEKAINSGNVQKSQKEKMAKILGSIIAYVRDDGTPRMKDQLLSRAENLRAGITNSLNPGKAATEHTRTMKIGPQTEKAIKRMMKDSKVMKEIMKEEDGKTKKMIDDLMRNAAIGGKNAKEL